MIGNEGIERLGMTRDKGSQPDTEQGRCNSKPALTPNPPGLPKRQHRGKSIHKTNNRCETKLNLREATTQESAGERRSQLDWMLTLPFCTWAHWNTWPRCVSYRWWCCNRKQRAESSRYGKQGREDTVSLFDWQVISEKWRKNENDQKCHYKSTLPLQQTTNSVVHRGIDWWSTNNQHLITPN